MLYTTVYTSPLGEMLLASDGGHLTGLWFYGQKYFPAALDENALRTDGIFALEAAKCWLDRYFAGGRPDCSELALAPSGTAFQRRVWARLCAIPYGQTLSYGDIAREFAAEDGRAHMSAQAIGGAVGRNPISVIIPCHRVLSSGGQLTGYAGGTDKKLALLTLEGVFLSSKNRGL